MKQTTEKAKPKSVKALTKADVMNKIRALGKIDAEQRNSIVCSLVGHSRIIKMCFGYVSCGRCDSQIGDTLGSTFDTTESVIVGHKCKTCRTNFRKLTWRDTLFVADPFKVAK